MLDAHNHLQFAEFDGDRDEVIRRARQAGLTGMILAGYDDERRELAAELTERQGISATAGLHPWALRDTSTAEIARQLDLLRELDWTPFCGLGELGLDWYVDDVEREVQIDVFRAQLEIARELDLPVVVHCVHANADVARILERDGVPRRGMIHSFWGSAQEARRFVGLGMSLSIGTQITRSQPARMRDAVAEVGLDHLLVETDAPSRPPAGVESDRNEPAYLPRVVDTVAGLLDVDARRVAETTARNARALFVL